MDNKGKKRHPKKKKNLNLQLLYSRCDITMVQLFLTSGTRAASEVKRSEVMPGRLDMREPQTTKCSDTHQRLHIFTTHSLVIVNIYFCSLSPSQLLVLAYPNTKANLIIPTHTTYPLSPGCCPHCCHRFKYTVPAPHRQSPWTCK